MAKEVTRSFSDTGGSCRRYGARIKRIFGRRGSSEGMPVMLRSMDFSADQLYKPLMITYIQPLDPDRNRSIYIGLSLRQSFVPSCKRLFG